MITLPNSDPKKLLDDIKAAIKAGTIRTWKVDSDGDFSHTDSQLAGKGFYLRPTPGTKDLRFRALFTDATPDKAKRRFAYAYLNGHMAEMITTHYPSRLTGPIEITTNPTSAESQI